MPVFLAAATVGVATAVGSLLIFASVTIGTIVGLTLMATKGRLPDPRPMARAVDTITTATLIVIGWLVLTGAI